LSASESTGYIPDGVVVRRGVYVATAPPNVARVHDPDESEAEMGGLRLIVLSVVAFCVFFSARFVANQVLVVNRPAESVQQPANMQEAGASAALVSSASHGATRSRLAEGSSVAPFCVGLLAALVAVYMLSRVWRTR